MRFKGGPKDKSYKKKVMGMHHATKANKASKLLAEIKAKMKFSAKSPQSNFLVSKQKHSPKQL